MIEDEVEQGEENSEGGKGMHHKKVLRQLLPAFLVKYQLTLSRYKERDGAKKRSNERQHNKGLS